jgi:hypothetical protein
MLYPSTSVGLGYGLKCRRCFPEDPGRPANPIRQNDGRPSSRSGRRGNINPLPIGYGSRPRLRGPANPARINLAQEPLDFRREGLSPSLALLMSAFALPMPPAPLARHLRRPTERSATTSEDRDQASGIRTAAREALQHAGNLPVIALPVLGDIGCDIAEIAGIKDPDLHFVGRARCHHQKTIELGSRLTLLAESFGNIGTDRFRGAPDLISQRNCSIRGNSRLARCTSSDSR